MAANSPELEWVEKKVLIIGRASPEPSKKHIETVCTGGIAEDGQVLRLYPISLRYLEKEKRYGLWTWATFAIAKDTSDKRKESYKVKEDSIRIIGKASEWSEKFQYLEKAIVQDRETLHLRFKSDWTSIGVVEIEVVDLVWKRRRKSWAKHKPHIKQFLLYVQRKPLEQLPVELQLRFRCKNNPACKKHRSSLIGWEFMEAFRRFREKYGSGESACEQIREKVLSETRKPDRRTFALMSTHRRYGSWMVAQLYFIPHALEGRLF